MTAHVDAFLPDWWLGNGKIHIVSAGRQGVSAGVILDTQTSENLSDTPENMIELKPRYSQTS